ncbi:MAG: type III pantothenate kinase [Niabella sp.]
MATTLCFDFGNTRKKVAVFNGSNIEKVLVLEDDSNPTIESLIRTYRPKKSILSSVTQHNPDILDILGFSTRFHLLGHSSKLPITTPVGKPETIGADRLALAAGGVYFYPDRHLLLVGLGTCITLNFVNKFKELIGGSISPGLDMRLRSMHEFTAQLPYVNPKSDVPLMGYDTETNLLTGVVLGMAFELDGFINEYAERFNNLGVVLTGGDARYLSCHLKNDVYVDEDLIFKGLYAISEMNN